MTATSAYARFSATLLAETILEGRRHNLEEVLARYLQFHGLTESYQLRNDMLWGAAAVADFVGAKTKTMFTWIEAGRFPHSRLGGGISARKSIVLSYVFTQELASLKGISLRKYVSSEGPNTVANDNAAPKGGLIIEP